MFSQIAAVTSINLRSIPQRWGMSLATILSIALVVGVLLGFLAMANGFRATVNGTGSESIAVLLRSGSQAELNSGFGRDTVRLIETAPGISRDADAPPSCPPNSMSSRTPPSARPAMTPACPCGA